VVMKLRLISMSGRAWRPSSPHKLRIRPDLHLEASGWGADSFSGFVHYYEDMVEPTPFPSQSSKNAFTPPTLASLDLREEDLLGAVQDGVNGAKNVTKFHPVTARGFVQWSETVASLRQALGQNGWDASDPKNSPRITSPDGLVSIMVIGGDEHTGVSLDVDPTTARRRGPATRDAVLRNAVGARLSPRVMKGQGALGIEVALGLGADSEEPQNWVLLYHWSTSEPLVRAELSLPVAIEDEKIKTWRHRILLPPQGLEEFELTARPAGSPDDDVDFMVSELS
jgi:hypothetical protein